MRKITANSMSKTCISIILIVFCAGIASGQQLEILSNMKGYARLPEDKIDLLEAVLQVSQKINPKIDSNSCRSVVSKIVETAKRHSTTNVSPRDKIRTLATTIHKTFGITIPDKPSSQTGPEYGMIDFVLNNKRANCLGLVTLYLIVSDRLGIPLSAETLSSHIVLKYDDGNAIFYVETTTNGTIHDNLDYLNSIIKGEIITGGRDLSPLSKKDIIAEHLYNAGVLLSNRRNDQEAIKCYEMALAFNNRHDDAYRAWGDTLNAQKDYAAAVTKFMKAIELNPKSDAAYTNMGLALNNLEKFDQAITAFRSAARINPKNGYTYLNWGIALICIGQHEEARSTLRRAQQLDKSLEPSVQRLMKLAQ